MSKRCKPLYLTSTAVSSPEERFREETAIISPTWRNFSREPNPRGPHPAPATPQGACGSRTNTKPNPRDPHPDRPAAVSWARLRKGNRPVPRTAPRDAPLTGAPCPLPAALRPPKPHGGPYPPPLHDTEVEGVCHEKSARCGGQIQSRPVGLRSHGYAGKDSGCCLWGSLCC